MSNRALHRLAAFAVLLAGVFAYAPHTALAAPAAPALLPMWSAPPLPPALPTDPTKTVTVSWTEWYQYSVDTSYTATDTWYTSTTAPKYDYYGDGVFLYNTLKADSSLFSASQINTAVKLIRDNAQNTGYTFVIIGHTDRRCNEKNPDYKDYWQYDATYSTSFCTGNLNEPPSNPSVRASISGTFNNSSAQARELSGQRATTLHAAIGKKIGFSSAEWASLKNRFDSASAGEWYTTISEEACRDNENGPCASERTAEIVMLSYVTATDTHTSTSYVSQTSIVTASTVLNRTYTCSDFGTCLSQPDFTLTQPAVKFSAFQQQGTRSLTIPAATVSCPGCKAPVSSGAPTTGWRATLESATLSGVSLTPPSGYTTPKHFSFRAPGSNLKSPQKITLKLNKATLAGSPYKLNPGTVTATVRMDPWLWDGQKLTWLTADTVRVNKTATLKCTLSTSCTFGVTGSNTAG